MRRSCASWKTCSLKQTVEPQIKQRAEKRYLVKVMKVPVDKDVTLLTDIPGMEPIRVPIRINEYPKSETKVR
ncbi:MAG: hypothetical protein U9Q79_00200 [Candidatus Hydrogenedentes bacterium]|nr:hypothetical protein [Candidatus Hydrogenedentota bacterium]